MSNKRAFGYIILLVIIYHVIIGAVYLLEDKLVFMPKNLDRNHSFECPYDCDEYMIPSSIDHSSSVIHLMPKDSSIARIVYYHGNSRNIQEWIPRVKSLLDHGFEIIMMDYRGFGKTQGEPNEEEIMKDAGLVFAWAKQKFNDKKELIIYGRSLGSSIASFVAQNHSAKALILEAPFYDMKDVIERRGMLFYFPFDFDNEFDTYEYLNNVDIPVYAIHGTEDWIVPIESFERLVSYHGDKINSKIIERGGHNDLDQFSGFDTFISKIKQEALGG